MNDFALGMAFDWAISALRTLSETLDKLNHPVSARRCDEIGNELRDMKRTL